jgi:hypothetical protein
MPYRVLDGDASEVSDGLDGLAEAHLIGQDHVVLRIPGIAQEVDAVQLVVVPLPTLEEA